MRYKEIFGLVISGKSLLEAPQTIGGTDFGMSDENKRYQFTKHLLNLPSKTLEDTNVYELKKCSDGNDTYYFALEKPYGRLIYFVKCETEYFDFIGQTVTQVAVWRDITSDASYGIADNIFFNFLLLDYSIVMSDEQQTTDGRNFWIIRMGRAATKGYKIGIADIKKRKIEWRGYNISPSDWIREHNNAWSSDPEAKNIRFVISK